MFPQNVFCKKKRRALASAVYGDVFLRGSTKSSTDTLDNDVAIETHELNLTFVLLVCNKK